MTKQEAIKKHRKLWNWIAEETFKQKRKVKKVEYFEIHNIAKVENYCYCCEYNSQFNKSCKNCPVDWNHVSSEKKECCIDSYFKEWLDTDDWETAYLIAIDIANLPAKEEE